jgi:hypothetical protein
MICFVKDIDDVCFACCRDVLKSDTRVKTWEKSDLHCTGKAMPGWIVAQGEDQGSKTCLAQDTLENHHQWTVTVFSDPVRPTQQLTFFLPQKQTTQAVSSSLNCTFDIDAGVARRIPEKGEGTDLWQQWCYVTTGREYEYESMKCTRLCWKEEMATRQWFKRAV